MKSFSSSSWVASSSEFSRHCRSPLAMIWKPARSTALDAAASWVTTSLQSRPDSSIRMTPAIWPSARRNRRIAAAVDSSSSCTVYLLCPNPGLALRTPAEQGTLRGLAFRALASLLCRHAAHDGINVLAAAGVRRLAARLAGSRTTHEWTSQRVVSGTYPFTIYPRGYKVQREFVR